MPGTGGTSSESAGLTSQEKKDGNNSTKRVAFEKTKHARTHARTHARAGKYDGEEAAAAEGGWGKEVAAGNKARPVHF